jgi:hypothetical protein
MYYIGLDVHKKTISYCVKDASGQVHGEGKVGATRWLSGRGSVDFHGLRWRVRISPARLYVVHEPNSAEAPVTGLELR